MEGKVGWIWWPVLVIYRPKPHGRDEAARPLPQLQKGSGWGTQGGFLGPARVLDLALGEVT